VYNGATNKIYLNIVDTSSNGTFVNSVKISNKNVLLKDGDKINLAKSASYVFRYKRNLNDENKENMPTKDIERRTERVFNDLYIMGKQLGSGHYATVNEAFNRKTGIAVAVKVFKPQRSDDVKSAKQFNQELEVLISIKQQNIVELIDAFVEPINKYSVTTYLVLEKVNGGELFTRIIKKQFLREGETKAIFRQMLQGLKYLHDRDILHRDIKPENILLNIRKRTSPGDRQTGPWDEDEVDVQVKIADFGLAKFIGEYEFTNTLCGTPAYVAPEVLGSTRKYSKNVDLWSSGVLLYVCLVGFPPFSDELGPPSMREQIMQAKYAFYSPYFDNIDDLALDLIARLLVRDPNERLDINTAMRHPWFEGPEEGEQSVSVTRSPVKGVLPKTYTELSALQDMEISSTP
jgi:serine/threonine-protein kinase Chk2